MPLTATDLVADARSRIAEISPQVAAALLSGPGQHIVIDVREPAEFEAGHIRDAHNIPRGMLEFQVEAHPAVACVTDAALSVRDRSLIVVCRSGARAALAADALGRMGFSQVRSIAGGVVGWSEAGLPLVAP
jgi:rhodanese-related sulfurtransferase